MLQHLSGAWLRKLIAVTALCGWLLAVPPVLANEIPWQNQTFERVSRDENIQDVIIALLRQNGLDVIFRPGVEGMVTFDFQMSLRAAFNKLIQEYNLSYEYDPRDRTVILFPTAQMTTTVELVVPQYLTLGEVRRALRDFGLLDRDVKTVFDPATSAVLLRGDPARIQEITAIIQRLDQSAAQRLEVSRQQQRQRLERQLIDSALQVQPIETQVIPLRFANVSATTTSFQGEDVTVPGIEETLRNLLGMADAKDNKNNNNDIILLNKGGQDGEDFDPLQALQQIQGRENLKLSVDQRTNSVIVRGTREQIDEVAELIERLDREVPLVDIEVMIVQADAGLAKTLGVQWAFGQGYGTKGMQNGGISTGRTAGQNVLDLADESVNAGGETTTVDLDSGTSITETANEFNPITLLPLSTFDNVAASFIYNGSNLFISAQLNALEAENKAQIISAPHVVTLNNVTGKITSSQKRHIPISTEEGGEGDIKAIDASLTLSITPSVILSDLAGDDDTLVRLNINAKTANFTAELATQEKEIQTHVILREGATFVMGGLFENTRLEGENGVPGLKEVPLLGGLFRNRVAQDSRAETIFFITPNIIQQKDLLGQAIQAKPHYQAQKTRDYLQGQQRRLAKERTSLQQESGLLFLPATLEEDE